MDGLAVPYAAARWLVYVAAFALVGAGVARLVVVPRARLGSLQATATHRTLSHTAVGAAVVLMLAHLLRLYFQTRSLLDPDEATTTEFVGLVLGSAWGTGWLWQFGAAGVAGIGWLVARRLASGTWIGAVIVPGMLLVVGTTPLTGHAVGLSQAGPIGPYLAALHFGAAATWIGTLGIVSVIGLARRRILPASRLIAAFSPVALTGGLTAMLAGVVLGYRYLGGVDPLITTIYGRVLLLKLSVLLAVAGIGVYNWRVVLPRLRGSKDPAAIRRSARLEAGLGLVLIAVTAILVALPAPGE